MNSISAARLHGLALRSAGFEAAVLDNSAEWIDNALIKQEYWVLGRWQRD
ncbi:hypothetical protein J7M28_10700 [bacterium]|nr:hypothetical protein [bacterium]